jgi:hypothetical protein
MAARLAPGQEKRGGILMKNQMDSNPEDPLLVIGHEKFGCAAARRDDY